MPAPGEVAGGGSNYQVQYLDITCPCYLTSFPPTRVLGLGVLNKFSPHQSFGQKWSKNESVWIRNAPKILKKWSKNGSFLTILGDPRSGKLGVLNKFSPPPENSDSGGGELLLGYMDKLCPNIVRVSGQFRLRKPPLIRKPPPP